MLHYPCLAPAHAFLVCSASHHWLWQKPATLVLLKFVLLLVCAGVCAQLIHGKKSSSHTAATKVTRYGLEGSRSLLIGLLSTRTPAVTKKSCRPEASASSSPSTNSLGSESNPRSEVPHRAHNFYEKAGKTHAQDSYELATPP